MQVFLIISTLANAHMLHADSARQLTLNADAFVRHGVWSTREDCENALTKAVMLRNSGWVVKRSNVGVIGELRSNDLSSVTLERMSCQAISIKD